MHLGKEWKNLESFRISADKRDFRVWRLGSKHRVFQITSLFSSAFEFDLGRWK
jgi:hypothetical protein